MFTLPCTVCAPRKHGTEKDVHANEQKKKHENHYEWMQQKQRRDFHLLFPLLCRQSVIRKRGLVIASL